MKFNNTASYLYSLKERQWPTILAESADKGCWGILLSSTLSLCSL